MLKFLPFLFFVGFFWDLIDSFSSKIMPSLSDSLDLILISVDRSIFLWFIDLCESPYFVIV